MTLIGCQRCERAFTHHEGSRDAAEARRRQSRQQSPLHRVPKRCWLFTKRSSVGLLCGLMCRQRELTGKAQFLQIIAPRNGCRNGSAAGSSKFVGCKSQECPSAQSVSGVHWVVTWTKAALLVPDMSRKRSSGHDLSASASAVPAASPRRLPAVCMRG